MFALLHLVVTLIAPDRKFAWTGAIAYCRDTTLPPPLPSPAADLTWENSGFQQSDVVGCAQQVEALESQYAARMETLRETVQSKTAVPTAHVYVSFSCQSTSSSFHPPTQPPTHLFIYRFINSSIHSLVHPSVCPSTHSSVQPSVLLVTFSPIPLIYQFTYPFELPSIHPLIHH